MMGLLKYLKYRHPELDSGSHPQFFVLNAI